jgi:hypothetical protein
MSLYVVCGLVAVYGRKEGERPWPAVLKAGCLPALTFLLLSVTICNVASYVQTLTSSAQYSAKGEPIDIA